MPIGKNALKRVTNNGYSAVNASAPDMENSVILEEKTEPKTEPKKPATKKPVAKKTEAKVEKKAIEQKPTPIKPAAKKADSKVEAKEVKSEEVTHPDGFIKVSLGMDMPTYLL